MYRSASAVLTPSTDAVFVGDAVRFGSLPPASPWCDVETPKSSSLTPPGVSITFDVVSPRWTMPSAWALSKASAMLAAASSA
jgi:hypothetical protein